MDSESDNNYWDIYTLIDDDINVERGRVGSYPVIIHPMWGRLSTLAKVEWLVREAANTVQLPFDMTAASPARSVRLKGLATGFTFMEQMLEAYDDRYEYAPRVEIFYLACQQLGLLPVVWEFRSNVFEMDPETGIFYGEVFNKLIEAIRELCREAVFTAKLKRHQREVLQREQGVEAWERALFKWKSRHIIIPLTLGYQPQYRHQITPERIQKDLERLLNNRRSNHRLKGMQHYVRRIEEGDEVGLHIHLLVAYNGKKNSGMGAAKFICDYWERNVTYGEGQASSGNFRQGSHLQGTYDRCAGKLDRGNEDGRARLLRALKYLAKADQLLKRKSHKFRTFDMSHPPKHSRKW